MSITERIVAWPKLVPPNRFNSSDETARADAYMCQLDAVRERLRDTAAALDELASAGISYGGSSKYDEVQLPKGLQADARAILARLEKEGLCGAQEDKT